jgi:hypothetical protein
MMAIAKERGREGERERERREKGCRNKCNLEIGFFFLI